MILISSCICLCPIYWSRMLSREWRCSWSSAERGCSNYIWVINNLITYQGATYIRDLTVLCNAHHINAQVIIDNIFCNMQNRFSQICKQATSDFQESIPVLYISCPLHVELVSLCSYQLKFIQFKHFAVEKFSCYIKIEFNVIQLVS